MFERFAALNRDGTEKWDSDFGRLAICFWTYAVDVADLRELLEGSVALLGDFAAFLGRSLLQDLDSFVDQAPVEFIFLRVMANCSAVANESENNENGRSKSNKVDSFAGVERRSRCSEHVVKA